MCGRYDNLIARDAYRGLFKANRLPKSNFPLRYNIAPTDQIPIVRIDPRDGEREVVMARWGLIPFWMKEKPKVPHINAGFRCFEKRSPNVAASYPQQVFTSGSNERTESSPTASAERT
jgi:putative SOS response-associated peptidase YedK